MGNRLRFTNEESGTFKLPATQPHVQLEKNFCLLTSNFLLLFQSPLEEVHPVLDKDRRVRADVVEHATFKGEIIDR